MISPLLIAHLLNASVYLIALIVLGAVVWPLISLKMLNMRHHQELETEIQKTIEEYE